MQEIWKSVESSEPKLKRLVDVMPKSISEAYEKILERATDPTEARTVLNINLAVARPVTCIEMNIALELVDMERSNPLNYSDMRDALRGSNLKSPDPSRVLILTILTISRPRSRIFVAYL